MKDLILLELDSYLQYFKDEKRRQEVLSNYLKGHNDKEIRDWNNFDGHVVASGFLYAKKEKRFLCLYHKDLKMYLYPGGHIEEIDKTVLEAAKREVYEETGIEHLEPFIFSNKVLPIDIDTHIIPCNERLNLPSHYHFDFRYLFFIEKIEEINIDREEHESYKWIDINELQKDKNFGVVAVKLRDLIEEE